MFHSRNNVEWNIKFHSLLWRFHCSLFPHELMWWSCQCFQPTQIFKKRNHVNCDVKHHLDNTHNCQERKQIRKTKIFSIVHHPHFTLITLVFSLEPFALLCVLFKWIYLVLFRLSWASQRCCQEIWKTRNKKSDTREKKI